MRTAVAVTKPVLVGLKMMVMTGTMGTIVVVILMMSLVMLTMLM